MYAIYKQTRTLCVLQYAKFHQNQRWAGKKIQWVGMEWLCYEMGILMPNSTNEYHKQSFAPRTSREWNILPADNAKSETTEAFKGQMHHQDDLGSKWAYTGHLSNKTTHKSVLLCTPRLCLMKVGKNHAWGWPWRLPSSGQGYTF